VQLGQISVDTDIDIFRRKEIPMSSVSSVSYSTTAGLVASATTWSASDVATLKSLAEKGASASSIAAQLDKSVTAVTQKIKTLGVTGTAK